MRVCMGMYFETVRKFINDTGQREQTERKSQWVACCVTCSAASGT